MTLPSSRPPSVPFFGLLTISSALSSIGVGVGGAAPKPKSGSVHESPIVVNPLTGIEALFGSHSGEKFVAQSVLPSKWSAKAHAAGAWMTDPSASRRASPPAEKTPRVKRTREPSGDQTQLMLPAE